MKHAEKNEFDLLLRGLARLERVSAGNAEHLDQVDGDHLDADELNSYAEDVLPSATRARYSAHLADCASCRKVVTQLTLTAGVVGRLEQVDRISGPSFWEKLAAYFTPGVWKFAGSALGVVAIVAISVILLRQQQPGSSVALRTTEPEREGIVKPQPVTSEPDQSLRGYASPDPSKQPAPSDVPKTTQDSAGEKQADTTGGMASAPATTVTEKDDVLAKSAEPRPSYAPEPVAKAEAPPPPPQPQPKAARAADANQAEDKEKEEQARTDEVRAAKRETRARDNKNEGVQSGGRVGTTQAEQNAPAERGKLQELNRLEAAKAKKDGGSRDADTRSAGGRQFRREGKVWVDTAYDSSRPVTNVKRGSEQYRALVADEPGLKSIAEGLEGTVIVVWKGRAYRIQ